MECYREFANIQELPRGGGGLGKETVSDWANR